jgi:raffinose/stachyose/melibiose transport system permease protein
MTVQTAEPTPRSSAVLRTRAVPITRPDARRRRGIGLLIGWLVLVGVALGVIFPLIWMVVSSFKTTAEIFAGPWELPAEPSFLSFARAWEYGVSSYIVNSVIVTVGSVVGAVLISAACAFGLTKIRLRGAGLITMLVLGGMMLSPTVALVPLYGLLSTFGLNNSLLGLIMLYVAYKIPFTMFLIRGYMLTLPGEVQEAAVIDGASQWTIFWRVIMPLCKPIIISACVLQALFAWNEFTFALVFISSDTLQTLPVGLFSLQTDIANDWSVIFAGIVISAIPMVALFIVFQRYFIRGLADGFGK